MKKIFLTIILVITYNNVLTAQDTKDTQKKDEIFSTLAPRVGFGFHNYINLELGISALYISNRVIQWGAASAYTTLLLQQTNWNSNSYSPGWKIGIQSTWAIFMWGIEFKTIFYNNNNYNYLSPKIGLGWLDIINIEYALNTIELDKEMPIDSRHQISINISINKKIYKEIVKDF